MGKTPNLSLPYPERTNLDDVPKDMKALAEPVDAHVQMLIDRQTVAESSISDVHATAESALAKANINESDLATEEAARIAGDQSVRDYVDEVAASDFGGRSAYEIAKDNGFVGSEADWLKTLTGPRGPAGPYGGSEVTDPQVASFVRDETMRTRQAMDNIFAQRIYTRPAEAKGDYINIKDLSADTSGASMLRLTDAPENSGSVINIYHHGTSGSQAYGINIANMPNARNAFVIHQYSSRTPAIQIDNTDVNTGIYIKNTDNQFMNPGNKGTGTFMQFLPYGETGGLSLTNGLIWLNRSSKDMKIQATNPQTYAFGVQMDADKTGLMVMKNATGAGNAAWITNSGTGHALFVSQTGTAEAFHVYSNVAGRFSARVRGNDHGAVITTQADSGVTLDVTKNGVGPGIVTRIVNKGTGAFMAFVNNAGDAFRVHQTGEVEIFTPAAGVIMRSPNGTRFKVFVTNDGSLMAQASA